MRVESELGLRRLLTSLLLVALLPMAMAVVALNTAHHPVAPGPGRYAPMPLVKTSSSVSLQAKQLQRSRDASRLAPALAGPTLVAPAGPDLLPTLVLPSRNDPYTVDELEQLVPQAFGTVSGAVLLTASLEVVTGATLVLDSASTPDVRLLSTGHGFTAVIARGGTIDLRGAAGKMLHLSSWDPERGGPDTTTEDGRAFVLAVGGRMDVDHAVVERLGFGTGTSSGMAWRGAPATDHDAPIRALGRVTGSVFSRNWFGAYTFEAQGMRWIANTFVRNDAYGFDPHDLSNDFLVEGNIAHGNGRHGFIFSRGCRGNMLRNNTSYDNRGHGFMIDDGRTQSAPLAPATRLPSDDNELVGNRAYDNDGTGIEVEGGTGNVVTGNRLDGNHVGVRLKDRASVVVSDNRISGSRLYGVDVLSTAGRVVVADNRIRGGWAGIGLAHRGGAELSGNDVIAGSAPLAVGGAPIREKPASEAVGDVFRWNPLLVLWTLVLGVPSVVVLTRGAWLRSVRRRRRSVPA